jgi:hypothetical protein
MHACMHAYLPGQLGGFGYGRLARRSLPPDVHTLHGMRRVGCRVEQCEASCAFTCNDDIRNMCMCVCVCTCVFPPGSAAIATRDTMRRPIPLRSRQEPHIKMQLKQCLCNSVCRNACLCICEFVGIGHGPVKGRDGPPRYGRERLRSASEVCRAGIDHVQGLHE